MFHLFTDDQGKLIVGIVGVITGFLCATIVEWLKAYSGVKGKNFATRQDFEELQEQVRKNIEITKSIDRNYSREDYLWRSELAFREQQLSELYGPAYGYLMSQKEIYEMWMANEMPGVNLDVKRLLSELYGKLRNLIINKSHLIDGTTMPDSFVRFFTSTLVFELYAARTESGSEPERLKADPRTAYPHEFGAHIIKITERLKARIAILHSKYAAPIQ